MSKKYEALAKQIVELVGGNSNIAGVHHCQTRLRFKLKDDSIADTEKISALDGVAQVINKGGMYQVVVGMQVAEIFEEVEKFIEPSGDGEDNAPKEKQKLFDVLADFVSSIFSPIVPALAGAGMVKALLAFLTAF